VWHDARSLSLLANLLSAAAALALLAAGAAWLAHRPMFTLARIELHAAPITHNDPAQLRYVSAASVRTAIAGQLQGNFFTVDLRAVRRAFESAPWVRRASVRRIWPDTLAVTVQEQQPLAFWNDAQLLNVWGEAFTANLGELEDDALMPQFIGPAGSETLVARRYAELMRALTSLGVTIHRLELTPRYAWQAALSNGMTLELGRDPQADASPADPSQEDTPQSDPSQVQNAAAPSEFSARITRFVAAWPEVLAALAGREVTHADLRHGNGFALTLVEPAKVTQTRPMSTKTPTQRTQTPRTQPRP